jgi:response regulator RpfG family c-di-GMP phosphodiesterase
MILVVGATREETIHIETCLKDWKYDIIPVNVEGTGIDSPIPKTPILMLVYAQQDPRNTIALCEQLRKDSEEMEIPILLVVGRYKMSQFYELRRHMENITSIITPFNQKEIRTRIDEILGTT